MTPVTNMAVVTNMAAAPIIDSSVHGGAVSVEMVEMLPVATGSMLPVTTGSFVNSSASSRLLQLCSQVINQEIG